MKLFSSESSYPRVPNSTCYSVSSSVSSCARLVDALLEEDGRLEDAVLEEDRRREEAILGEEGGLEVARRTCE